MKKGKVSGKEIKNDNDANTHLEETTCKKRHENNLVINKKTKPYGNEREKLTLREKCPNTEFFLVVFSSIRTEYGDLLCKSQYSVRVNLCIQSEYKKI